jgi:hypothetical protein
VPLANVAKLLTDDYKGYMPLVALVVVVDNSRSLLTKGTINVYITAMLKL